MEKEIYKKIDKIYGEDIGDLIHAVRANKIAAAKKIADYVFNKHSS